MPVTLAAGLFLLSWYKPLVVVVIISLWAWVVSTIYDKDAAQWYLPRQMWNFVHMAAAIAALGVVLFAPLGFWVSVPIMAGILAVDLVAYALYRQADSRVPESAKWTINLSEMKARAAARKEAKKAKVITLQLRGPDGDAPVPDRESPEYEVRVWTEELIEGMIDARGVQLDITPLSENQYGVSFMVDGVRKAVEKQHANKAVAIIDFLKQIAGLDVEDRRRRLVADIEVGKPGAPLTPTRLITAGSSKGQRLTLLFDPQAQVLRSKDDLGMHPNQEKDFDALVKEHKGVVLVAAPPDNGLTTTLYTLLREHDAYTSNVQSIEIDPQATIEGVRQNRFTPGGDAEYSTLVRSILRRDPDVVSVSDMPDENTAKEIARCDHERTRVYFGLRADGSLQAVQMYARAVGDQKLAAESLHGVIAQRLVRRLCANCKTAFKPTPEMLKKLGLPRDTKQLYKKSGQVLQKDKPHECPVCNGTGFFGQVGVFEVHDINAEERKLIAQNDMSGLRASFRQKKQQSFQHAALQHVVLGNTSVEEVIRVTQSSSRGGAAKKPSPSGEKPKAPAAG